MNYYQRMLPVCNSIVELLQDLDLCKDTLTLALTHLSEERPFQALEVVCDAKKRALLPLEISVLEGVEDDLALTLISHAQEISELRKIFQTASLSPGSKMVLWARVVGLKYRSPIPVKGD